VVRLVDRLGGGDGDLQATALTPIERQALELFALVALDGVCQAGPVEPALRPRLAAAGPPTRALEGALGIELTVRCGSIRGAARLVVPPGAVRALSEPASHPPPALAIPVAVRSGVAALDLEELEALAAGDVLLLREPPSDRLSLVLPGGFRATGRLGAQGFLVEETHMSTHAPQIPITLEVELARIELPLADLCRLAPGTVLPLALDRRGLVTLRAGEHTVARGELVDVDGAVGVRIDVVEVGP
jgi:type III secretion protein Q